jgi:hypothetical protein
MKLVYYLAGDGITNCGLLLSTKGMWTRKIDPSPIRLATVMLPRCASVIHFAMDKPSPDPPDSLDRDVSAR